MLSEVRGLKPQRKGGSGVFAEKVPGTIINPSPATRNSPITLARDQTGNFLIFYFFLIISYLYTAMR